MAKWWIGRGLKCLDSQPIFLYGSMPHAIGIDTRRRRVRSVYCVGTECYEYLLGSALRGAFGGIGLTPFSGKVIAFPCTSDRRSEPLDLATARARKQAGESISSLFT